MESKILKLIKKYKCTINILYSDSIVATIIFKDNVAVIQNNSVDLLINEVELKCKELAELEYKQDIEMLNEINELSKNTELFPNDLFKNKI